MGFANLPVWAKMLPVSMITAIGEQQKVDPHLIAAVIQVESGGVTWRLRAEPTFAYLNAPERWAKRLGITKETEIACQKMSWGLMQVMGGTARDIGYEDHISELVEPEIGVYWGTVYLARQLKKYQTVKGAVAAYNAGSLRIGKDGKIVNQSYVDKVMALLSELRGNA